MVGLFVVFIEICRAVGDVVCLNNNISVGRWLWIMYVLRFKCEMEDFPRLDNGHD